MTFMVNTCMKIARKLREWNKTEETVSKVEKIVFAIKCYANLYLRKRKRCEGGDWKSVQLDVKWDDVLSS